MIIVLYKYSHGMHCSKDTQQRLCPAKFKVSLWNRLCSSFSISSQKSNRRIILWSKHYHKWLTCISDCDLVGNHDAIVIESMWVINSLRRICACQIQQPRPATTSELQQSMQKNPKMLALCSNGPRSTPQSHWQLLLLFQVAPDRRVVSVYETIVYRISAHHL